ncbi:hypothetical protein FQA39_LY19372 [Lamprigera yunnana]|nr:hypothetical protein FQA39_LY19372 [Lamprigera yunnana]
MAKAGISAPMAIFMSLLVYAGSAQLAVLPLLAVGAPLWVIWFTAACVNLRFVILSSMWRIYFAHLPLWHRLCIGYYSGDVIFVAFMRRYSAPVPKPQQVYYFWGASGLNFVVWQGFSIVGILMANVVPLEWGLGFAGVLALLGVLYSMLMDRATTISAADCGNGSHCGLRHSAQAQHSGGDCLRGDDGPAGRIGGPARAQAQGCGGAQGQAAAIARPRAARRRHQRRAGARGACAMSAQDWELLYQLAATLGLTAHPILSRAFFMIPKNELPLPDWLKRGLKYAPLAALTAVIAPEVLMSQGELVTDAAGCAHSPPWSAPAFTTSKSAAFWAPSWSAWPCTCRCISGWVGNCYKKGAVGA